MSSNAGISLRFGHCASIETADDCNDRLFVHKMFVLLDVLYAFRDLNKMICLPDSP